MVGIEACDDERIACLRYIGTPSRLFLMTHGDLSPLAHSGGEGARRGNNVVDDFVFEIVKSCRLWDDVAADKPPLNDYIGQGEVAVRLLSDLDGFAQISHRTAAQHGCIRSAVL